MRRVLIATFVAGLAHALAAPAAQAEANPIEDRLRSQLKQTTLELRAAQDELGKLKSAQATLQAEADAAKAQAAKPAVDPRALREARAQAAGLAELRTKFEAQSQALAEAQRTLADSAALIRLKDSDLAALREQVEPAQTADRNCRARNAQLVAIGDELLARWKDKSPLDALGDAEPFTGLWRLKIEAAAQDLHARIVDATVPAQGPVPPLPAAAAAAPAAAAAQP